MSIERHLRGATTRGAAWVGLALATLESGGSEDDVVAHLERAMRLGEQDAAVAVAVADVYDALVSKRVYKSGMTHEEAGNIIREGAGRHFDPRVVEAFSATEDKFRQVAAAMQDGVD